MSEKQFVAGMFGKMPTERDKHFVIGRMSIRVDDCIAFLEKHQSDEGWMNVDILQRKSDPTKLNFVLNTWKPKQPEDDAPASSYASAPEEDSDEQLPF